MKRKQPIFIGICLLFIVLIFGAGCSKPPEPKTQAEKFVKAWNHQDFTSMYQILSPESKKQISESAFVTRYQTIYKGIEAKDLSITLEKPTNVRQTNNKKGTAVTLPFQAKMDTVAGPLSYSGVIHLTKLDATKNTPLKWTINWTPALILKSLDKGEFVNVLTLPAKRGEILDRNGQGLAINGKAVQIGIYPKKWSNQPSVKGKLAALLHVSENEIDQDLHASWVTPDTFVPIKKIAALNSDLVDQATSLPGVMSKDVPSRVYPCSQACSHLIGYVGAITKEMLDQAPTSSGYTTQSIVGKTGLEAIYENRLRAHDGAKIQILDRNKDVVTTIANKAPKNGQTIKLTIDMNVQETLYNQLNGDNGTAVALNPKTGDVLGLVSTPAYDPNAFVLGLSDQNYQALVNDPNQPLLTRFTKTYSPGSSLKPLIGAMALQQDILSPSKTLTIKGNKWKKDGSWGNYYITRLDYLQHVNLQDALVYSDNIFFAQTALNLGAQNFINGLKSFGFTEKIPFDYPLRVSQISNSGSIPTSLLLANSGYGQGEIRVNPLHLALGFTAFVNQGNIVQPKLLLNEDSTSPLYWKKNVISPENASLISDDLKQVVNSPQGTAYKPYVPGLSLAGKTGTAEFKKQQGTTGKEDGWFVAYNTDPSNLLISMMIENVQNKGGSHYVVGKVKQAFAELK